MTLRINDQAARYIGYFSEADQETPAYDPGPDAPCPYCEEVLAGQDVRTISIMATDEHVLSLFYRVHRLCADSRTVAEREDMERRLLRLASNRHN